MQRVTSTTQGPLKYLRKTLRMSHEEWLLRKPCVVMPVFQDVNVGVKRAIDSDLLQTTTTRPEGFQVSCHTPANTLVL